MTAGFDRSWRIERQARFTLDEGRLLPFAFDAGPRLVYDNVNLSIFVDDYCNGDCDFCVARMRYETAGHDYIKEKIPEAAYLAALNRALEAVSPLAPSVSITGGEPTLCRRLPRILDVMDAYPLRKRTMTTNGSGLLAPMGGETLLDRLARFGLAHLNISRAHYDERRNQRIMKLKDPFDNGALAEAVGIAADHGIRPRLSCVLLRGHIQTVGDITAYCDWARSMGVDNVVFRQLMQYDPGAVTPCRASRCCDTRSIPLPPLWDALDADPRFEPVTQVLGYYYYVEVFRYREMDIVTEAADLAQIPRTRARLDRRTGGRSIVYEMVFHPSGVLSGSWREWEDVLIS